MPDLPHGLVKAILHAVTTVADELVSSGSPMPIAQFPGRTMVAQSIILIEHRVRPDGGILAVVRNSWQQAGVVFENQTEFFPTLSWDMPADWSAALKGGRSVQTSRRTTYDEVRDVLTAINIEAMLLIPILIRGELWGTLGIESKTDRDWEDQTINGFQRVANLISDAITREQCLRESEDRLRTIFNLTSDGIFVVEPGSGAIIEVNAAGVEMFGYHDNQLTGKDILGVLSNIYPYAPATAPRHIEEALRGQAKPFECQCQAKDGRLFWAEISIKGVAFGKREVLITTLRDVTVRKTAQDQVVHLANHDFLTGLPNRSLFVEMLEKAISRGRRNDFPFAVLYLDLDHFKDVIDTLGHPIGEELLQIVSRRLCASAGESDTVARFGGDEFAVLTTDVHEQTDAGALAERFLASLHAPFTIQGNEIRTCASIGIAFYGANSPNAERVLSQADLALYQAKNQGRGTHRFFTRVMDTDVRHRVTLSAQLKKAIESEELFLVYQPQVELDTRQITGLEALVRWRHPQGNIINPGEFIPLAESSGLIVPLGRWVMKEACRQMKLWIDAGIAPATVAVNLSCLQCKAPRELEREIDVILAETGLPPRYLELELTESALMDVSREHTDVLKRLRGRGIRLAIDDFGTGYSSLDYLHRYPVDRLKIAQVFVRDLVVDRGATAIVKAVIGLAHALKLNVTAEGIETSEQAELLRGLGCRDGQGFYFSKPLRVKEVESMLRHSARARSQVARRAARSHFFPRTAAAEGLAGSTA